MNYHLKQINKRKSKNIWNLAPFSDAIPYTIRQKTNREHMIRSFFRLSTKHTRTIAMKNISPLKRTFCRNPI
ncbi:hypothetical protein Hdeb2414_s0005g00158511 [Helianthus debilis subsp. tardiflorus]